MPVFIRIESRSEAVIPGFDPGSHECLQDVLDSFELSTSRRQALPGDIAIC
ncbi:MAG: hypothetical protein JWP12_1688, partial [Bacteroidetes bacterium]|nr:hypothetical protein [Bacteroidota bacterium]